jgi:hypothetical protein
LGAERPQNWKRLSRAVYERGRELALERGIIIADAKFEYDPQGRILLIDEVLTPDSSRFWPAGEYQPGRPQPSFDKQPLRAFLDQRGVQAAGTVKRLLRSCPPNWFRRQADATKTRFDGLRSLIKPLPMGARSPGADQIVLVLLGALTGGFANALTGFGTGIPNGTLALRDFTACRCIARDHLLDRV